MGKILKKLLSLDNYFPTRITTSEEIKTLIKTLRPIETSKSLIRVGPDSDGGYLLPDDLSNIAKCFSPGVNKESGFEKYCSNMGMSVFMADGSVEKPVLEDKNFYFTKKYIGATSNENFLTMNDWVSKHSNNNEETLIQMDIEGYEYEVLLSTDPIILNNCRILIVEFHHLDQLWNKMFFNLARSVFEKILETHMVVHLHPNNCCGVENLNSIEIPKVMEFTFYNKRYIDKSCLTKNIPHILDRCNVPNKPRINLSEIWFG